MSLDMSKYLGLFVTEATEHLEALGKDLLALEKGDAAQAIDSMFRHAHSVKGMAASMGYEGIASLSHRVEDLVDAVRSDPKLFTRELGDLILSATDSLLTQVRAAGDGKIPEEPKALIAQLAERVSALTGRTPEPTRVANVTIHGGRVRARLVSSDSAGRAPPRPESETGLGLPPALRGEGPGRPRVQGAGSPRVPRPQAALEPRQRLRPPAAARGPQGRPLPDGVIALELETSASARAGSSRR